MFTAVRGNVYFHGRFFFWSFRRQIYYTIENIITLIIFRRFKNKDVVGLDFVRKEKNNMSYDGASILSISYDRVESYGRVAIARNNSTTRILFHHPRNRLKYINYSVVFRIPNRIFIPLELRVVARPDRNENCQPCDKIIYYRVL